MWIRLLDFPGQLYNRIYPRPQGSLQILGKGRRTCGRELYRFYRNIRRPVWWPCRVGGCATLLQSVDTRNNISPWYYTTGFTAIVDKQLSAKYERLVNRAPELIQVLPWGKDFEVDIFRKPDFTALEVVSFATGGKFWFQFISSNLVYDLTRYPGWDQCKLSFANKLTTINLVW